MSRRLGAGSDALTPARRGWVSALRFALALYATVAVGLFVVVRYSVDHLPFAAVPGHPFPDHRWFEGWTKWDTGWYYSIANDGYTYSGPGAQSPVAFFPAYPFLTRLIDRLLPGDALHAGVLLSYLAGLTAVVLFNRWATGALGKRVGRWATALLLVYPFSFYLFGAVYSDALFLCAVLSAFVLLEKDHPVLAGIVGAVATAARPVGLALTFALVLRSLEIRGLLGSYGVPRRLLAATARRSSTASADAPAPTRAPASTRRGLRSKDLGVLLSVGGIAAYCALLAYRFGEPFAFAKVAGAPGWNRTVDLPTILKNDFFTYFENPDLNAIQGGLALQAFATLASIALLPAIVRRLGWGYAAYVAVVVGVPAASSSHFIGMGRYVLVAFPCFAVAADLVAGRKRRGIVLAGAVTAASAIGLVFMTSFFARWYFLS